MKWQPNPNYKKFIIPVEYTDLGWQISLENQTYKNCYDLKHTRREFDNSMYLYRCTDVITICDECKFIFHIDMSD
jgi:hypothetical protein